jgi:putative ABC transport system permease protein
MLNLVLKTIGRRRTRTCLTIGGIGVAVAVLLVIEQLATAYRSHLMKELNSMSLHLMLVPLGCPYDAAARVLKGNTLEVSMPEDAARIASDDPDVDVAAPLLIAAVPRPEHGRTDMFIGLNENGMRLRPWWKAAAGTNSFAAPDSIILGADAAEIELREPGDAFYSPETDRTFKVAGVLQRSGTSDDSLFFLPLATAQAMFNSSNRLTAVAIRLKDPAQLHEVSARLQNIPGTQVITQTEMMGTFLNVLGNVRTLLQSVAWVALAASIAGLMNTLLMSVAERNLEFSLFRALGASRYQVFGAVVTEGVLLTLLGTVLGILFCATTGAAIMHLLGHHLPLLGKSKSWNMDLGTLLLTIAASIAVAIIASLAPAWRASSSEPGQLVKGAD